MVGSIREVTYRRNFTSQEYMESDVRTHLSRRVAVRMNVELSETLKTIMHNLRRCEEFGLKISVGKTKSKQKVF